MPFSRRPETSARCRTGQGQVGVRGEQATAFPRLALGVSACLLGQAVRYDGGHKRHAFLTDTLSAYADYLPICPEAAIGLGVPRPPIRLVGEAGQPRALGVDDPSLDVTEPLRRFSSDTLPALASVSGYIFKKNSPSCGLQGVEVFDPASQDPGGGYASGIFAAAVLRAYPLLPVADEDSLDEAQHRDNFITRIYVYRRWQDLRTGTITAAGLLDFHAAHKYLIMAHSQTTCQQLGQLLSNLQADTLESSANRYARELMTALRTPAPRTRHCNALQHISGYLKSQLSAAEKSRLSAQIEAYRAGQLALHQVIEHLGRQFERFPDPYISSQVYLHPYPRALLLHKPT